MDTSRPKCDHCGTRTVRAGTQNHKGIYTCPDPKCPESMKVWYRRGSRRTGIPGHRMN